MKSLFNNPKPNNSRNVKERQPRPFILALMLTGILAFQADPNLTNHAIADAEVLNAPKPTETNAKNLAHKFALLGFPKTNNNELKISANSSDIKEEKSTNNMVLISQTWLEEELSNLEKLNPEANKANDGSLAQNAEDLSLLPTEIADAVREDLQRKIGIPPTQVKVTKAERQTWPNACLGLAKSDELCAQMLVEGWRIELSDDSETWVYRTDDRGRRLRMEPQAESVSLLQTISEALMPNAL
jgi:hypothetical protein